MGMKEQTVGGGAATGFAPEFIKWLQGGLSTGTFGGMSAAGQYAGANPMGSTQGFGNVLNDIMAGGAGQIGGSMQQMIEKSTNRNADALRARFGAQGGQAFGTPAAFAEATMRAEQAPQLVNAIGGLQLQALMPILQMMMGVTQMGTPQSQTVMKQNPWVQGIGIGTDIINAIGNLVPGGSGGGGNASSMAYFDPASVNIGNYPGLPGM